MSAGRERQGVVPWCSQKKTEPSCISGSDRPWGVNVTSLLMERLPPDDFARSGEVQLLTHRVDNIASTMKVMIGSMITVSTVMIGLLVQIALSVR